jgi:hypothetical protein
MANLFVNLPLPAMNGPGAAVDTSGMGIPKTIVIAGDFQGATITVEASTDGGATFAAVPSGTFADGDHELVTNVVADHMRVNVRNRKASLPFSANIDVGATDNGAQFAVLTLPALNGPGPSINVSALGYEWSFIAGGSFPGSTITVEVSEDGTSFAPLLQFAGQGGLRNAIVTGDFVRANVKGRKASVPFTGSLSGGAANAASATGGLVDVQNEGVSIGAGPFTILDFAGDGVAATDAGGGTALITISNGAILTPAAIGGVVNNYAPATLANATLLRQDLTAASTITGVTTGIDGRRLTIININATQANQLTIGHENLGSAAANRFTLPSALDWIIPIGGSATFVYDGTSARWRMIAWTGNVMPAGTLANPGFVVGATPTRGWRDAGATFRSVNAGVDVLSVGSGFGITGNVAQSGGSVAFNTGTAGFTNTGPFSTSGSILSTGDITPAALTGVTQNDYNPAPGVDGTTTIRQDLTAATSITGMDGTLSDGRIIIYQNIATVLGRDITFEHENAGSIAGNRFNLPNQAAVVVPVGGAVAFRYDVTSGRWRLFAFVN